jgi:hypothetical protein
VAILKEFHVHIYMGLVSSVGVKLETLQLLAYADDMNLLGDSIETVKKNTQTLIDMSKEVGLEVKAEKTKYIMLSCHHNAAQYWGIYLGTTVTNQTLIQEELMRRLTSGNACYHRTFCLLICC